MANITAVKIADGTRWQLFEWSNVTEADTPLELDVSAFTDPLLIFSAAGTFGGATISAGGGDVAGEAHPTLEDALGDAISFAAAGRSLCVTSPLYVLPARSGGSSASIDIRLLVRW